MKCVEMYVVCGIVSPEEKGIVEGRKEGKAGWQTWIIDLAIASNNNNYCFADLNGRCRWQTHRWGSGQIVTICECDHLRFGTVQLYDSMVVVSIANAWDRSIDQSINHRSQCHTTYKHTELTSRRWIACLLYCVFAFPVFASNWMSNVEWRR